MLLALLSDSHDNQVTTQMALELLRAHHPGAYLHAGDLVAPQMLELFSGLPFYFVFGNNEYDHAELRSRASILSLHCHDRMADLTFAGKRIAMVHGHDDPALQELIRSGAYHYIIHGHTHLRSDKRVAGGGGGGRTRVINPGALHRAQIRTVALLDVLRDELRFLELPRT